MVELRATSRIGLQVRFRAWIFPSLGVRTFISRSRAMQALGFSVDDEKQFSMAVMDVSLEFARQMKNEHLSGLDADKMIAFRIFKVDSAFIEALRAEGLKISEADKLV